MLKNLQRFLFEIFLVSKILPFRQFIKWVSAIPSNLPTLLKTKSMGILDEHFGTSFDVLWIGKRLHFNGLGFGVVMEIYGHLCYIDKGKLKEATNILDLGGNGGAFTMFALVEAPNAKIHAVEAQAEVLKILQQNVKQNGYEGRVTSECAVVGGFYD